MFVAKCVAYKQKNKESLGNCKEKLEKLGKLGSLDSLKHSRYGVGSQDDVGEEDGVEVDVRPSQVQQPGDLV